MSRKIEKRCYKGKDFFSSVTPTAGVWMIPRYILGKQEMDFGMYNTCDTSILIAQKAVSLNHRFYQ
jgi:hypothetical protein